MTRNVVYQAPSVEERREEHDDIENEDELDVGVGPPMEWITESASNPWATASSRGSFSFRSRASSRDSSPSDASPLLIGAENKLSHHLKKLIRASRKGQIFHEQSEEITRVIAYPRLRHFVRLHVL